MDDPELSPVEAEELALEHGLGVEESDRTIRSSRTVIRQSPISAGVSCSCARPSF